MLVESTVEVAVDTDLTVAVPDTKSVEVVMSLVLQRVMEDCELAVEKAVVVLDTMAVVDDDD